eukprot:m.169379 g.169379  ORF g.169379 m.169379 type:complete len:649 (+) comp38991_c0_seq1:160-2106(+)
MADVSRSKLRESGKNALTFDQLSEMVRLARDNEMKGRERNRRIVAEFDRAKQRIASKDVQLGRLYETKRQFMSTFDSMYDDWKAVVREKKRELQKQRVVSAKSSLAAFGNYQPLTSSTRQKPAFPNFSLSQIKPLLSSTGNPVKMEDEDEDDKGVKGSEREIANFSPLTVELLKEETAGPAVETVQSDNGSRESLELSGDDDNLVSSLASSLFSIPLPQEKEKEDGVKSGLSQSPSLSSIQSDSGGEDVMSIDKPVEPLESLVVQEKEESSGNDDEDDEDAGLENIEEASEGRVSSLENVIESVSEIDGNESNKESSIGCMDSDNGNGDEIPEDHVISDDKAVSREESHFEEDPVYLESSLSDVDTNHQSTPIIYSDLETLLKAIEQDVMMDVETEDLYQDEDCSTGMKKRVQQALEIGGSLEHFSASTLSMVALDLLKKLSWGEGGSLIPPCMLRKHTPLCTDKVHFRSGLQPNWVACWDTFGVHLGILLSKGILSVDAAVEVFRPVLTSASLKNDLKIEKAVNILKCVFEDIQSNPSLRDEAISSSVSSDVSVPLPDSSRFNDRDLEMSPPLSPLAEGKGSAVPLSQRGDSRSEKTASRLSFLDESDSEVDVMEKMMLSGNSSKQQTDASKDDLINEEDDDFDFYD